MFRRTLTTLFVLILLGGFAVAAFRAPSTAAQDPTIPTRTPTPDPNAPNPPPGGGGGGGDNNNGGGNNQQPPAATETPVGGATTATPGPTATSGGPVNALPGGVVPVGTTASGATTTGVVALDVVELSCGDIPYVMALSRIAVHGGPGIDYSPLTTLERDELRPIIGRAAHAPWWQVQVAVDQVGWVADAEVKVLGSTLNVVVVDDPLLNGVQPTAGAPWNPTPQAPGECELTPTPTATPVDAKESGGEAGAVAAAVVEGSGPANTPTAEPEVVVDTESESAVVEEAEGNVQLEGRGVTASRASNSVTANLGLIIPLAGLALIAAGIALVLMTRGRGQAATEGQETES